MKSMDNKITYKKEGEKDEEKNNWINYLYAVDGWYISCSFLRI